MHTLRSIVVYLGCAVAALAAWTIISAAMAFAMPAGRSLAVLTRNGAELDVVLAAGGLPLTITGPMIIARSDDADFARKLYRAGALLVLDAEDAGGCVPVL